MTNIETLLERIAVALETLAFKEEAKHDTKKVVQDSSLENEQVSDNNINVILKFLTNKNIQIKTFHTPKNEVTVLDNIANFIGTRNSEVAKTYNVIKSKLSDGSRFTIDLKNETQATVASSTQLCCLLHDIAFLSEYKYFKSPQYRIVGRPSRSPIAINFLTGGWLERFVKYNTIKIARERTNDAKIAFISNPQIILPNGDDFELDLLLSINEDIYWFESKTGNYQNYVEKYSKMAKLLSLDKEHAFMVLTELSTDKCDALSSVFNMNVVNIENFIPIFKHLLSKKYVFLDETEEQDYFQL